MSNRRVKALSYDEDDYEDYDDDDYEDEAQQNSLEKLNSQDQEQLRLGSVRVREALGAGFAVTDEEIRETLWHYYYDVALSVSYLKNKHQPKPAAKSKPTNNAKTSDSPTYHPGSQIPKDFFYDCPWLQIPAERRAVLVPCTSLPRWGLLGGSTKDGKMSKLAALAAKRRQKENQKSTPTEDTAQKEDYTQSLNRLSLTQSKTKATAIRSNHEVHSETSTTSHRTITSTVQESGETVRDKLIDSVTESTTTEEKAVISWAMPSSFAQAMFTNGPLETSPRNVLLHDDSASAFDFLEPSPDDIVNKAQRSKATPKPKLKPREPDSAKADVASGVGSLSIHETPRIKSKNIDAIAEYRKVQRKKTANFVVIGHVDAGKSTLMGRLLFDLEAVDQRTLDKYKKEAESIGKGSFAFAWVLDQGTEERERGITIDIATNRFETDETSFTILDAPGHQDFVPNMIAGASQADFAVLVIDASGGNFESGLKGQTKEHALLVRSMGVQRIIVAVNKMDMNSWSEGRYREIEQQISGFLTGAGFQAKNLAFIPCSGLEGDNILVRSSNQKAKWYTGHTLVEELDLSEPVSHALDKPFRMTIADVFRGSIQNPLSVSGRLEAGTIQIGEQIQVMPSGEHAQVKSIEVDYESQDWAVAGQNIILNLTDIDPIHLRTGDILCSSVSPIQNVSSFRAKILAFEPLTPQLIDIHRGRLHVPGRVAQLLAILDKAVGSELKKKPKVAQPGAVVRVSVQLDAPVPLEAGQRIIFRAGGETIAAGLIE